MKSEEFIRKYRMYELAREIPSSLGKSPDDVVIRDTFVTLIANFCKHLQTVEVNEDSIDTAKGTREQIKQAIINIRRRPDFHLYINLIEFLKQSEYVISAWLLQSEKNAQFYVKEGLTGIEVDPEVRGAISDAIIGGSKGSGVVESMSIRSEPLSSVLDYTLKKLSLESKQLKKKNDEKEKALKQHLKKKGYSDYSLSEEEANTTSTLDLIRKGRLTLKMRDE